ncbi:class I SAM-dependent methyltransferase [Mollicutes bacterium LVI A0039]|nr:class I SAM-dependent methyltransferase [Mollicutes bacterium LVI A0039]
MKTENNIKYVRRQIAMFAEDGTNIIDATCGNGNDSLYLATAYPNAKIVGFDIQEQAIANSNKRCHGHDNVQFILDSHANVSKYVSDNVSMAIFNLGYLPHADQNLTTKADSTIAAIEQIMNLLNPGGAIILTMYRGATNIEETTQLLDYVKTINKDFFIVSMYDLINLSGNPFNVIIERK